MDKLRAMQTVVRIADEGSLSAAARALATSLPSVVRTLAALEQALQVRLFHRTTRRISLTEEGKSYLATCRQVLAMIDDAEASMQQQEPSGQLTITAPVTFGQMHVAPAVTRFVQRHPRVSCHLLLLDRVVDLLEEQIDVGIRIGELADSSLIAQGLGHVRRMVVASPTWLAENPTPQHPRDLLQANCIVFTGASGPWWAFHQKGQSFNLTVKGNLSFNHVMPALDACVAGLGLGMFISYQVDELIAAGALRVVLEEFEPPPRPIHIVYPSARLLPSRTRAFIQSIKQDLQYLGGAQSTTGPREPLVSKATP